MATSNQFFLGAKENRAGRTHSQTLSEGTSPSRKIEIQTPIQLRLTYIGKAAAYLINERNRMGAEVFRRMSNPLFDDANKRPKKIQSIRDPLILGEREGMVPFIKVILQENRLERVILHSLLRIE